MAHLYQRGKKKVWYVKFYHNGKQVLKCLKTTNFRIARDKAKILEAGFDVDDYEKGIITQASNKPKSRISIKDAIEEFCQHLRDIQTKNSYDSEISRLRKMFGPICRSLEYRISHRTTDERPPIEIDYLHELNIHIIRQYFASQRRLNRAPSTQLRNRAILHKFFEWASRRYGYRSTDDFRYPNPIDAIQRPVLRASVIRFLEKPDIKKQLRVLKSHPQLQTMVATCIYAGLRREEVVRLTCSDVDLKRRLIYIRAKTVRGDFWQPKTKKNRAVPISKDLMKFLKSYDADEDRVWYFPSNSNRMHPDTFSHYLTEINRKAGLDWTCLDFRHTFGSQLAKRGISLFKISELMGNSPEVCRRHYAAIRTEHLHEDVEF